MKREILNHMLATTEGGELLNGDERQMLNLVIHRLDNPGWEDERPRAERLKAEQTELREIVLPALERLCNAVVESYEGAVIVARMGLGEPSEIEKEAARSTKEITTMMAAIRTSHPLDPDTIADGEFLITE